MDNFYEQLNKTEKPAMYSFMKLLSYIFFAFAAIFLVSFNLLFLAVSLLFGLILFFTKSKFLLEYEYGFNNGKINIDVIMEKKKRKNIVSFSVRDIEAYGEENLTAKYKHMGKIINAISTNDKNKVYGIYVIIESQKYYIRFTPDQKFYDLIQRNNRRAEIK